MDQDIAHFEERMADPLNIPGRGRIHATRNYEEGTFTCTWEGGDTIALTHAFLRYADPRYATSAKLPDSPGDRFTVGPYLLETIGPAPERDMILAKRVYA